MAGANEALIDTLASQYDNMSHEQRSGLLTMNSQVLGVLVASMAGGDEKDMQTGAWVAGNATNYNRQLHPTERELAQRLAEESEGRYTVEQIEEQLRLSNITDTAINPGTDMLVGSPEGIYDTGGRWIEVGDGQYIQVFSTTDISPEITGYISEKTSVYDWEMPKPVGWDKEYMPQFDYNVCLSCAAGFSYQLNPASLRTIEEIDAGQRALTLGMASTLALPIGWYVLPSGAVLTGTALGAGFDAAGQLIGGNEYRPGQTNEYRPGQTVIAGVTGGLTYPLAGGGLLGSMALGGTYGGTNRALNNYVYDEDKNAWRSARVGSIAGGVGHFAGSYTGALASRYLPRRINGAAIDPDKPILLQSIGVLNPYPGYVGKSVEQVIESTIPVVLDRQGTAND